MPLRNTTTSEDFSLNFQFSTKIMQKNTHTLCLQIFTNLNNMSSLWWFVWVVYVGDCRTATLMTSPAQLAIELVTSPKLRSENPPTYTSSVFYCWAVLGKGNYEKVSLTIELREWVGGFKKRLERIRKL